MHSAIEGTSNVGEEREEAEKRICALICGRRCALVGTKEKEDARQGAMECK